MVRMTQETIIKAVILLTWAAFLDDTACHKSLDVYLCYLLHSQSKTDVGLAGVELLSSSFRLFFHQFLMNMFSDKVIQQIIC